MTRKKIPKTLLLFGLIGMLGVSTAAYAYQGDYTKKGPEYTEERHDVMEETFTNHDYATWK